MARLHVLEPRPRIALQWRIGRIAALVGLAALLASLVIAPRPALATLWYLTVPLLPLSFFVSPAFWRGICPLSTLNALGNRLGAPRAMRPRETAALGVAGLLLFHLVVPARHLGLNTQGPLLAATLIGLALVAVAAGARFESRSAFCNALCPVLPIERLYGQAPLVRIARGRCDTCSVCTPNACLDLADQKAMRQMIGPARKGDHWLRTPFGIFAAALPGFIVGYALVPDTGWADAARVYGATLAGSLASYAIAAAAVRIAGIRPLRAVVLLAALSGLFYYWVTAPTIVSTFALAPAAVTLIRVVAVLLLSGWSLRALRQATA